eukprot:CAMPEP_0119029612 /NCGR_PEP_ID=MMETSP1176-20130426/40607_1 /TAXON_ID=265551 /ORGANISM="Synedropsis recta cf, Strain CCMP1620" /LENGTH=762 /DNA_ID=CAMNT_0006985961 /DNA_START=446 /DNA_END=2734 /DNA_ORIENTATION=-
MADEEAVEISAPTMSQFDETEKSLALDAGDDPFAAREGKTLTWRNIDMTLAGVKDEKDRKLLDKVWGEVPAKQTTAVMGPSGAGKTSLLNILAGRAATRGRIKIEADIRLNNYEVDPTNVIVRQQIAFVAQDDSLQVTSTPREAIRFSAKLRLPRYMTERQLDKLTNRMLSELGLEDCADTIVGGALIKGISGGQRKRTSVGVELVTKPALVFLDEPTSGLDSYSAVQLCQVLKKVANAGSSVLFTIHQPSSEIFNSFDRKQIAFVAQDDSLQVTSTPREAIRFSAKLRLPRSTTDAELQTLTNRMLSELGLEDCADTIVGGALIKGISGGQRKRTSVGIELVTKPALVFLDEPTSGLDSYSAVQLCQVLKKVANAGASVLFTIHQPSSEIFNSFDHLILLNKGRVMYQGAVSAVPDYFGARNHPSPPNYNPADWIMNVAQSVELRQLDADGFFPEDEREVEDPFEGDETSKHNILGITTHSVGDDFDARPVGFFTELSWLFHRELTNFRRDTAALFSKFGLTLFLGILIGIIFLGVGATDPSEVNNVNSRFGALVICLMMGMFGTAQDALLGFPTERPVFLREYSTNHYSVFSYFMSRLTMEAVVTMAQIFVLTITTYFMIDFQMDYLNYFFITYALSMASTAMAVTLGSAVDDPKLAAEMLPLLFVPQMLFAGFFVATELIPVWLRWAQYLCSLTYALRLMVLEEFSTCLDTSQNCAKIINRIDANSDDTWWYWLVLVGLFAFFRLLALTILAKKATKFY